MSGPAARARGAARRSRARSRGRAGGRRPLARRSVALTAVLGLAGALAGATSPSWATQSRPSQAAAGTVTPRSAVSSSPSPTGTPTLTPTPSPTPSPTPTLTPTLSPTPTLTPTLSPTPSPTDSLTPTPSPSPTVTPTATPTPTPTPTPKPTANPYGPDVASYQHPGGASIDWASVKRAGEAFVFVKASEGAFYDNPYYAADAAGARQAGLLVGAYHFARPGSQASAAAQARHLVSVAGLGRADGTLPLVLDLEDSGGLPPSSLQAWTRQFLDTVKALTGRTPVLYTYVSFWRNQMGDDTSFSGYPLWQARYASHFDNIGGWSAPTFWQYTSSARIPGVQGNVDRSQFLGSMAALTTLGRGSRAAGPTQGIGRASGPSSLVGGIQDGVLGAGFDLPWDNGGARISGFEAQLLHGGGVTSSWNLGRDTRSVGVRGLQTGWTYQFRVRALNSQGAGAWSSQDLPAVATTRLGLQASTATPGCGQRVTLTARLGSGPSSTPFAGQSLAVSVSRAGGAFTALGTLHSDARGLATAAPVVSRSSRYLITYPASAYRTAARAQVALVCIPSLRLGSVGPLRARTPVTLSAVSGSGDATGRGVVQMFNGRAWANVATVTMRRSHGALRGTTTYTFGRPGTYALRLLVVGTAGSARAASRTVRLRIR